MRRQYAPSAVEFTANRWSGARLLQIAHRLNARGLALFADQAIASVDAVADSPIRRLSPLWAQLDDAAQLRAARCPVLLLDLHFQHIEWWMRATQNAESASSHFPSRHHFPEAWAQSTLQEILIEAWSAARSMPFAVSLVFGMAPAVCTRIATLAVPDLDRIVHRYACDLHPRWSENISFWRTLLTTSIAGDDEALSDHHLHCLQLLVDGLIPQPAVAASAVNRRCYS